MGAMDMVRVLLILGFVLVNQVGLEVFAELLILRLWMLIPLLLRLRSVLVLLVVRIILIVSTLIILRWRTVSVPRLKQLLKILPPVGMF